MSLQTVVATDVAELLMQGHEQSALNLPMAGVNDELERHASSSAAPAAAHDSDVTAAAAADASSGINRSYINSMPSQTALDRFRQLCLFGRKKVRQCTAAVATSFMIS